MLILREVVITSTPSAILTSRAQLENTFTFLLSAITILRPWSGCNIWTGWFLCNNVSQPFSSKQSHQETTCTSRRISEQQN